MINKRKPTRSNPSTSSPDRPRFGRLKTIARRTADVALLAGGVIVVGYLAVFAFKVGSGYSQTREAPAYMVKLQLVNASGQRNLVAGVKKQLEGISDLDLTVEVVETSTPDLTRVSRTVLVSRDPDREPARMLAARLGLDPDEVEYKRLDHNTRFVTASLILGRDAEEVLLGAKKPKEKT